MSNIIVSRRHVIAGFAACAGLAAVPRPLRAGEKAYSFGVLNQRSVPLIAQYWNPILAYLSRKSGVALELKVGRTAPETTAMALRRELDFTYSNHLFRPDRLGLGYHVIAAPATDGIRGQIVVMSDSRLRDLNGLKDQEIAFPSKESFAGYQVPMDALIKAGVVVKPIFAGNQEGAMGQLRAARVSAAAVNSQLMAAFALREGLSYRVLWQSDLFRDIPVMAHDHLPQAVISAVQSALVGMGDDPEGMAVLRQVADIWGINKPIPFVRASDADYESYRRFYAGMSPSLENPE